MKLKISKGILKSKVSNRISINRGRWGPHEIQMVRDEVQNYFLGHIKKGPAIAKLKLHMPNRTWERIRKKFNALEKMFEEEY